MSVFVVLSRTSLVALAVYACTIPSATVCAHTIKYVDPLILLIPCRCYQLEGVLEQQRSLGYTDLVRCSDCHGSLPQQVWIHPLVQQQVGAVCSCNLRQELCLLATCLAGGSTLIIVATTYRSFQTGGTPACCCGHVLQTSCLLVACVSVAILRHSCLHRDDGPLQTFCLCLLLCLCSVVNIVGGLGLTWQPAFGIILVLYFYSHYFFASGGIWNWVPWMFAVSLSLSAVKVCFTPLPKAAAFPGAECLCKHTPPSHHAKLNKLTLCHTACRCCPYWCHVHRLPGRGSGLWYPGYACCSGPGPGV